MIYLFDDYNYTQGSIMKIKRVIIQDFMFLSSGEQYRMNDDGMAELWG